MLATVYHKLMLIDCTFANDCDTCKEREGKGAGAALENLRHLQRKRERKQGLKSSWDLQRTQLGKGEMEQGYTS